MREVSIDRWRRDAPEYRGDQESMTEPRHFRVADAMILTAATAAGIAGTRPFWQLCGNASFWSMGEGWSPGATLRRLTLLVVILLPGLAALTVAVLLARFIPPRPSGRRIALQPGSAACGVALLGLIVEAFAQAATLLYFEASKGYLGATWQVAGFVRWFHVHVLLPASHPISFAVFATWALLSLSRRARPEPSWVDRAGRALGICWFAVAFLVWFSRYFLDGRLPGDLF
jgi:hypothetical protein